MEITLRRAAAVQDLIRDLRATLGVSPVASVSVFGDVAQVVADERAAMFVKIERADALSLALYEIRRSVARANVESGVSDLLAEQARLGGIIEALGPFVAARPFEGDEVTARRAERAATREEPVSGFGRGSAPTETIQVSLLSADDIEKARVRLLEAKRQKTAIKDRLAELNAVTRITLSAETEKTLSAEHLL